MNSSVVVQAARVSKKFARSLRRSMRYGVADILRDFFCIPSDPRTLRPTEFWSVKDVSFEVRRGECLGIIGPNGAGKSTILKMLNGIFPPEEGNIEITGRVGALIEVGAGFHPMLTGRENIYINGSILGMTKKEIDERFDAIVEFSELAEFIDTPVKFYSSGMYVRLGFSIAAQMQPDLLLIDEILAVGDVGFRSKCYEAIADMANRAAVVFVSHSIPAISRICDRVLVMNHGRCECQGAASEGIETYQNLFHREVGTVAGTGEAQVTEIQFLDENGNATDAFEYGKPITISFAVEVSREYDPFLVSLAFSDNRMEAVAQCHSRYNGVVLRNTGDRKRIQVAIPGILFNPGRYYLHLLVYDKTNTRPLSWHYAAKKFQVHGDFTGAAPVQWQAEWNVRDV